MNTNLLVLGIAGIVLLLALLRILRRDNNNTGDHAIYGPTGTDDLPQDIIGDLKKMGNKAKGVAIMGGLAAGAWAVSEVAKQKETVTNEGDIQVEEFRNVNDFANDNLDILKGNKCHPGCCPGTYSCDVGCVCMTSAQKQLVGNRRGGNRTQYDHNNDF